MKISKSMISMSLILSLFVAILATTPDARATSRSAALDKDVQACIAGIGSRIDYSDADRVMHWVSQLRQKSLAELDVDIETRLYSKTDERELRSFRTVCTIDSAHRLVDLRIVVLSESAVQ